MSRLQITTYIAVLAAVMVQLEAFDKGFELMFTTNSKEFSDEEITFDNPIPDWLDGTLFHNGLGMFEHGNHKLAHFFDGYAKINSIKLQGGSTKALFTNKFVRGEWYNKSIASGDVARYMTFDQPVPKFKLGDKLKQIKNGMDNTNVNILCFGDDLVAVADLPRLYTIDGPSLNTLDVVDPEIFDGKVSNNKMLSSAHPLPEAGTKNWISIVTEMNPISQSSLYILRTSSAKKRTLIKELSFKRAPYMHSYAATEKYVILFVDPVYISFLENIWTGSPKDAMTWDKDALTYIHVIETATGKHTVLETEPSFGLHHVNAFETAQNGRPVITIDVVTYPNIDVIKEFMLATLLNNETRDDSIHPETARLKRYVIDLEHKQVKVNEFAKTTGKEYVNTLDFPVFNELFRFKNYCYVYGVVQKMDGAKLVKWALVKKDLCNENNDRSWYKPNHYPGEPWFETYPDSKVEDDGVIMSIILDGVKERSYLAMFNATTLDIISKAYFPTYLPMVLHGRFMASKAAGGILTTAPAV